MSILSMRISLHERAPTTMSPLRTHKRRPRSIRGQLVGLVAAVAVPMLALQVWSAYREYGVELERTQSRALALAEATAVSAKQFLAVSERLMSQVSAGMGPHFVREGSCGETLQAVNGILDFLANLVVVDARGSLVCSALPVPEHASRSAADRDWFMAASRTRTFTVGSPRRGSITHAWVIAIAAPILDDDGHFLGALGGSVLLTDFQSLLAGVRVGPRDLVTVADRDHTVLARSTDPERYVGRARPPEAVAPTEVGSGQWITSGPDFEGVDRTWGKVRIPELGWTVFAGIPSSSVVSPARAAALRKAGLGLGLFVVAILLATLFYRRIAQSLRSLVEGTRAALEGEEVPVPDGAPLEVLKVVKQFNRTLRGRNRAEQSERRAKERYRSILDNAVFGIYVSTRDGRFVEVNPALVALLGYASAEELIAVGPGRLYADPDDRDRLVSQYERGTYIQDVEVDWLRKDGTVITVRLNGKVIRTEAGDPAFEVILEDITEEKRKEEELRHTQKMEAVGRLAGGVAHDFNNLLTVIGGNTQLLMASLVSPDPLCAYAEEIVSAADRATVLTRQLLAFSRKDPIELRVLGVNELIDNLEKMLGRLIGEDVQLETRLARGLLAVRGDAGQIEQILMNLVLNARDALPRGGRIVVETRNALKAIPPGEGPTAGPHDWVILSVTDNGTGMNERTRSQVFEPFFTTKGKGEGTGLGLATVYGIVRRAGGWITVRSELGRGSRFDVWLPAVAGEVEDEALGPGDELSDRGSETILAVEDEEPVRKVVQRVLEGAGYEVLLASDGQEALDLADEYDGTIHLVLTDVVMPRVKGTELADRLSVRRPGTPILFMSGYTDNLPIQDRVSRDPEAFLAKPFTPQDLRHRVRLMLNRWYAAVGTCPSVGQQAVAD